MFILLKVQTNNYVLALLPLNLIPDSAVTVVPHHLKSLVKTVCELNTSLSKEATLVGVGGLKKVL